MNRQFFYPEHNKASILIICLSTIMILSIMGMGLAGLVFQQINFSKSYMRLSFSTPVADAALKQVFYFRADELTPTYDTKRELTQEKTFELCNGVSYKYYFCDDNSIGKKTEIIDEGALINLNIASVDLLKRLPGLDEDLADKIISSGLRPFSSINEVLQVEGLTKDKFLLFRNYVTVLGKGKININTAAKEVLLALGMDEELVDIIIRCRKEHKIEDPKLKDELDPDCGFSSTERILDDLRDFVSLSLQQEQEIISLLSYLDVKSEYLRFNIIPFFANKAGLHYSIVIHPATQKIISWKEH